MDNVTGHDNERNQFNAYGWWGQSLTENNKEHSKISKEKGLTTKTIVK